MSVLAALAGYYDRLAARDAVPPYGYSMEKIGFCIILKPDGTPDGMPTDLREQDGRKLVPPLLAVPQPAKRTSGVAPNFLWDKTAYVLGVTAGPGRRTAKEHTAFVQRHLEMLDNTGDGGLGALLLFLKDWTPAMFDALGWPEDMKDQNVVFRLGVERRFIHQRPAALTLWADSLRTGNDNKLVCLVSGAPSPVARLHPAIKGVWGAQSSGASIVSFNLDAFTSYGHKQGDNAPISEKAAFTYTTVLNALLARDSKNRLQIGDASTVFWADGKDAEAADFAEGIFGGMFGGVEIDDDVQAAKVGDLLDKIASGRPLEEIRPDLPPGVDFFVLGLSPNAARLSVRYWFEGDFRTLAERYVRHATAMRLEPPPHKALPSIWRCLIETAPQRKTEHIPPQLAGDVLRAILTGGRYPQTLLVTLLMRLRADKDVNALRVALLKAVLCRNYKMEMEAPVSLEPESTEPGYLLGRLFATYEHIQRQALGGKVNATIKDKFYGAASATPRQVFSLLTRGAAPHLARLRKDNPGLRTYLEKHVAGIMEMMKVDGDPFPASLPPDQQALFALGYYHQTSFFFRPKSDKTPKETAA